MFISMGPATRHVELRLAPGGGLGHSTSKVGAGSGRPDRTGRVGQLGALFAGAGALYLVVSDGAPGWRVVRALAVALVTFLGAAALRHPGPRSRAVGWLVVLAGGVATAAGVGIVVPALDGGAVTPAGIAGAMLVVGGLVVVVAAALRASQGLRPGTRALTWIGILVILVVCLYTVGQAVAATNVPGTEVGGETPADRGLEFSDVRVVTDDGVELAGWYVPSDNGAAVVLRHGAGSTRSDVLDHAAVLGRNGYGVLALDARGHGDSAGRAMDFGWYGEVDIAAAVSFLEQRPEVDPGAIAVVGMSMGGEEAIGALATDERIAAVVAEGVGQRVAADKEWLAERYGWRGQVQVSAERLMYGLTDLLTEADPPIPLADAVSAAAPRPVLVIAGGAEHDEPEVAGHLVAASPANVQQWVVAGAGHIGALRAEPDEWERRVVELLDRATGRDAG